MVKKITFKNKIFSKKELKSVVYEAFTNYGITRSSLLADKMKEIGFNYATIAGISISIEDLKVPPTKKKLLAESNNEIKGSDLTYARGEINSVERFQKIIDTWNKTSENLKESLVDYFKKTDPLNSIYLMAFSGARGNLSQVRQLVGMRGLMSDPNGQIMDIPIVHNFREGLTITDYIMSAYGARKGVVDTALKTADSGYLTRRLIDVAQDVIIRESDCFTKRSIKLNKKSDENLFNSKIIGRTSAQTIHIKGSEAPIVENNQQITTSIATKLNKYGIKSIKLHSPLTCESTRSICQKCYGWNLATGKIVKLGEAIGIIAAQSIGEPGTQLTMRTFHTGGIFTADPSRQIRSKSTGIFSFNSNIQQKVSRTVYGSEIILLEREAKIQIIDYKNIKNETTLPADSVIFVKNKSFVKTGELIAELPLKNQQTIKAKKSIIAPHSGELFVTNNAKLVWIMENEIYNIPYNAIFNNFKIGDQLKNEDNLFSFKLVNKKKGIVQTIYDPTQNKIEKLEVGNCSKIFNFRLFWDKKIEKLVLKTKSNQYFLIEFLPSTPIKNNICFASLLTNYYTVETGGTIGYSDTSMFKYDKRVEKKIVRKNGKILFLPLETHTINKDKSLLLVENLTKIKTPGTELVKGIFSKTNGFLQTKESNKILQEIQVKPGEFFEFYNLPTEEIIKLKKYHKRICFPGEIIFEDVSIKYLTLIEIIEAKKYHGIILRPIQEFNIPKSNNNKIGNKIKTKLEFKSLNHLNCKITNKKIKKQKLRIIESSIWLNQFSKNEKNHNNFTFKIIPTLKNKTIFNLALINKEILEINNFLAKKLNNEKLKISLFIKQLEYIEPQTLLGIVSIVPPEQLKIESIKKIHNSSNSKVILTSQKNYKTYYSELNTKFRPNEDMVKKGDNIAPRIRIPYSGKIISFEPSNFKIQKGTPFYITPETKLYKTPDNFIGQNEVFGLIYFEQIITGDIVQGLPKVEEILEARKPQNPAVLAHNTGVINQIDSEKIQLISKVRNYLISGNFEEIGKKYITTYDLPQLKNKNSIIVKKNEYVYLGQALTEGSINPHNLLVVYFEYYKNFGNDSDAAYMSFKNIQLLLIQKVQQVYNSQGVSIADKHLEVIIKRISSKVQISSSGESFLLPGEIIELKQINYINQTLTKSGKILASYNPILLGITKASLLTDSFISAASFQETTKILTVAAIEGKIDWLRGLKENVIIGRLIPAGTGFSNDLFDN